MEDISAVVQWILGLLGLISASEAGVIIRQMWVATKARREAKTASECGHKTTHDLLNEIISAKNAEITKLQRRVARLEKEKAAAQQTSTGDNS